MDYAEARRGAFWGAMNTHREYRDTRWFYALTTLQEGEALCMDYRCNAPDVRIIDMITTRRLYPRRMRFSDNRVHWLQETWLDT